MSDNEIKDFVIEKYKDLPDGIYEVSGGDFTYFTGRGGYIESEIALIKALKNYKCD